MTQLRHRLPRPRLGAHARQAARLGAGGLALLFAFTTLYVAAFHAPRAKGLDVGVVGAAADAKQLQSSLDVRARGAFDVRRFDSVSQARAALLDTDVHGVVVPRDRVLVAGAFGPTPTQTVTTALRGVARTSVVEDVRPLPAGDRRGLSSLFTVVGTLIPSLVFGALLSVFGRAMPARVRWGAVAVYATLAGLVVALDVDVLVGALTGDFVGIAVVSGLLALAVSAAAHGLGHLAGPGGIVIAILTLLLLGLSSAGGAVTYQLQPGFFGAVSQLLPPGAALTAVRNVEYFDWAATLVPLLVLGAWAAGGLAFGLLGEVYGPHVRNKPASLGNRRHAFPDSIALRSASSKPS
jgi:hypothetical protein